MRKQRAQNLSAIEAYLEVTQVDFMLSLDYHLGNFLSVAEVSTTHIAPLAYASALSVGGLWTEADLQLSFHWPTPAQ